MTSRTLLVMTAAALSAFVVTLAMPQSVKPALAWTAAGGRGCGNYNPDGTRACGKRPREILNQGNPRRKHPPHH
jgi:hypothetical protein